MAHYCSILPPHLLKHIIDSPLTSPPTLIAAQKTYDHVCRVQDNRVAKDYAQYHVRHGFAAGIIPPHIFQSVLDSDETSSEEKGRAKHHLAQIDKYHAARADHAAEAKATTHQVYRKIYTSAKTNDLEKILLFEEGAPLPVVNKDHDARNVYDFFGKTYQFYNEVYKAEHTSHSCASSLISWTDTKCYHQIFDRNSIDDNGLPLIGSVHFDDAPGPPGFDNAFFDGKVIRFPTPWNAQSIVLKRFGA